MLITILKLCSIQHPFIWCDWFPKRNFFKCLKWLPFETIWAILPNKFDRDFAPKNLSEEFDWNLFKPLVTIKVLLNHTIVALILFHFNFCLHIVLIINRLSNSELLLWQSNSNRIIYIEKNHKWPLLLLLHPPNFVSSAWDNTTSNSLNI